MHVLTSGEHLDDLLAPYRDATRPPPAERPWVLANMVAGLDGSAAVRGRVGALSDETDRRLFHLLRSLADVVLVGAATVRAERYGPARITPEESDRRALEGRPPIPAIAVVTRSLELDTTAPLFATTTEPRPLIVTCADADERRRRALQDVAEVIVAGEQSVDLAAALGALRDRGATTVLCEGGPAVLGQLVEERLLDELCLTLAPVMGGDAVPVSVSPMTSSLVRFRLAHVLRGDDTLFLRFERREGTDG